MKGREIFGMIKKYLFTLKKKVAGGKDNTTHSHLEKFSKLTASFLLCMNFPIISDLSHLDSHAFKSVCLHLKVIFRPSL